jgi:hypothetical protein
VSNTTFSKLMLGRDGPEVADVADPASALVSGVDVMKPILAAATDTMAGGRVRRLQEPAAAPRGGRNVWLDEGGELRT